LAANPFIVVIKPILVPSWGYFAELEKFYKSPDEEFTVKNMKNSKFIPWGILYLNLKFSTLYNVIPNLKTSR